RSEAVCDSGNEAGARGTRPRSGGGFRLDATVEEFVVRRFADRSTDIWRYRNIADRYCSGCVLDSGAAGDEGRPDGRATFGVKPRLHKRPKRRMQLPVR